jgi:hypothetical protein
VTAGAGPDRERTLRWGNETFEATFAWSAGSPVVLRSLVGRGMSALPAHPADHPLVDVLTPTDGRRPGSHRTGEAELSARLRQVGAEVTTEQTTAGPASVLRLRQRDERTGLEVDSVLTAWAGVSGFQATTTLRATRETVLVEAVTTVRVGVLPVQVGAGVDDLDVLWARSGWATESRWQRQHLREAGVTDTDVLANPHLPRDRMAVSSTSSWSTGERLPVGVLTTVDDRVSLAWQVEHPGAWSWEIAEDLPGAHVAVTGPTQADHQWSVLLTPGESFTSVPASVVLVAGGPQEAFAELTLHRRALCGPSTPHPVVFNDYMNTLFGDPTTTAEVPLIDAAGALGAEVYCIDAGWYDDEDGGWWDTVGAWEPSVRRFPGGGLPALLDRIRERGMVPGLWLEPEVVGVASPLARALPEDAFFQRRGVRVVESGRYHLDLRSPAARAHLDATVDRLVSDLGVGMLKLDYNIMTGSGTDARDASTGEGLLGHGRAYLDWLDGLRDRYPRLLLENCASGAMRMDYGLLSRMHLQSTSDQCDPLRYAAIAAAAPASVLPEQAGSWAYAQQEMTAERAAFTLAAGILGRLYLSGFVDRMDAGRLALVREAVGVHREVLTGVGALVPFWPLGLPGWEDDWVATGLRPAPGAAGDAWFTLWRRGGPAEIDLPLPAALRGGRIEQVFPRAVEGWSTGPTTTGRRVTCHVPEPSARVFRVRRTG